MILQPGEYLATYVGKKENHMLIKGRDYTITVSYFIDDIRVFVHTTQYASADVATYSNLAEFYDDWKLIENTVIDSKPSKNVAKFVNNHETYANIIEWMHIHDGSYPSKNEWRLEFCQMLKRKLGIKPDIQADENLITVDVGAVGVGINRAKPRASVDTNGGYLE